MADKPSRPNAADQETRHIADEFAKRLRVLVECYLDTPSGEAAWDGLEFVAARVHTYGLTNSGFQIRFRGHVVQISVKDMGT